MALKNAKQVVCPQRSMRIMSVKVDGTGTAALSGTCSNDMTLTVNGTGDYTLTFDVSYKREPEVIATPITDNIVTKLGTVAVGSVQILTENLSGTATDADFHAIILGSDTVDQMQEVFMSSMTFDMKSPQFRPRLLSYGVTTGAAQVETVTAPAVAGATQADFIVIYNQAGSSEALWLDIDAAGTAPTATQYTAAGTKTKVSVVTGNTAAQVAAAIVAAITLTGITVVDNLDGTFSITQNVYGACSDAVPYNAAGSGAGSITVAVGTQGLAASLGEGKFDGTIAQTVAGTYVITFEKQFLRAPEVGATVKTDNRVARVTACLISSVTIETQDLSGGAAADGNFSLLVLGSDHQDFI